MCMFIIQLPTLGIGQNHKLLSVLIRMGILSLLGRSMQVHGISPITDIRFSPMTEISKSRKTLTYCLMKKPVVLCQKCTYSLSKPNKLSLLC